MLGAATVRAWHQEEAEKVLEPIERFLKRHNITFSASWVAGSAALQIVQAARREKVHMVVMGTHGHGLLGRALLGSVAQRVVADVDVPVLLVK
jgi:nucleotide-binding universal stress UspA family protein